jgi:hypothetical protein
VAAIYRGALSEEEIAALNEQPSGELQTPGATSHAEATILPEALGLTAVPDISADTLVGHLPQLPHMIEGEYRNGAAGPKVRVIWPFSGGPRISSQTHVGAIYPGTSHFESRQSTTQDAGHQEPRQVYSRLG